MVERVFQGQIFDVEARRERCCFRIGIQVELRTVRHSTGPIAKAAQGPHRFHQGKVGTDLLALSRCGPAGSVDEGDTASAALEKLPTHRASRNQGADGYQPSTFSGVSLSKKGSRLITVEGVAYRWSFSQDSGYAVVVLQHGAGTGQRVEAQTGSRDWGDKRPVTPAGVARLITFALTQGWNPTDPARCALRVPQVSGSVPPRSV